MQQQQFEQEAMTTSANAARSMSQVEPVGARTETEATVRAAAQQTDVEGAGENPLWLATEKAQAHQSVVEDLLRTIEREAKKSQQANRRLKIGGVALMAVVLLAVLVNWVRIGHFPMDMLGSLSGLAGLSGLAYGASQQRKTATKEIAHFEDKRAIGPMIDALGFNDREVTAAVMPALTRQLPQLQASDAALVSSGQRDALGRLLLAKNDTLPVKIPDFYAAILKALQQIGDEKSLPTVERVARGEGMAAYYPEMKAQAEETLAFLRQRIEQARASQTLLRASAPEERSPETLLRAAAPTQSTEDPQQLLRADPH